jgi:hypothetical protein
VSWTNITLHLSPQIDELYNKLHAFCSFELSNARRVLCSSFYFWLMNFVWNEKLKKNNSKRRCKERWNSELLYETTSR